MGDVAKIAGVSHQTVSRVLNGYHWVSQEAKESVLEAVEKLGYRRNMAARALASKESKIIGTVVTDTQLSGPSGTLLGIEQAAHEAGYWVSVASMQLVDETGMTRAVNHFIDQGADGIAVIAPNKIALDSAAKAVENTPMVLVTSGSTKEYDLPYLDIDQKLGARLAVRHLIELGHVHIAHFSGPRSDFHALERIAGWQLELAEHGLPAEVLFDGAWDATTGYELAQKLLQSEKKLPTAVFAANDQLAIGALRAFGEAGLRIPEDISVVGFDDILGTEQLRPPLTTIRQDHTTLGRISVEMLLTLIGGGTPECGFIPPTLVRRASSGPARS
jgi:DNA-binding LacI/PurR family transcriptional regulator